MIRKLALSLALASAQAHAQVAVQDFYGPVVEWRQASGFEVTPIHVGLLPDGDLFFINEYNFLFYPGTNIAAPGFEPEFVFLMTPTPADAPPPESVTIQPLPNPPSLRPRFDPATNTLKFKTLVCGAHALMANGDLFFASGAEATVNLPRYFGGDILGSLNVDGLAETFTWQPSTGAWIENPATTIAGPATGRPLRWYATVTRLADSRMLVTGGYEKVLPSLAYNPSVEVFDPATNAWSALSGIAETPPGIENPDYTHVFQFPDTRRPNTVMMIGGSGEPMYLSLGGPGPRWHRTGTFRPGATDYMAGSQPLLVFPNHGAASALLPLRLPEDGWGYSNGSVIVAGGAHHTPMEHNVDVYDPASDAWRPSIPLHGLRHHPSMILLPDGRILLVAGHNDEDPATTGFAEYIDPRDNFKVTRGSAHMPETRGYHAISVLLPDGRVLVGGGNVDGRDARERSNFRYYYPDYMFKPRPRIGFSQDSMALGSRSVISVPHGTAVAEAALVGLGSMTHAYDMNQRHVQVRVSDLNITAKSVAGRWVHASAAECAAIAEPCFDFHAIQAPASPEAAPPGHYMLFILDANRVPSTGRMMRLDPFQGIDRRPGVDFGR